MKKRFLFFYLLFSGGLTTQAQLAGYGNTVDFERVSKNKYVVRYTTYRDCKSKITRLSAYATCKISSYSGSHDSTIHPKIVSIREISNWGKDINPCDSSSPFIGIREELYADTFDFSSVALKKYLGTTGQVRFSIESFVIKDNSWCCRSGPGIDRSTNWAIINVDNQPNNAYFLSTPTFNLNYSKGFYTAFPVSSNYPTPDSVSYLLGSPKRNYYCSGIGCMPNVYDPAGRGLGYSNPNATPPIGIYFNTEQGELIYTPTGAGEKIVFLVEATIWSPDINGNMIKSGLIRSEFFNLIANKQYGEPPIINGPFSYSICNQEELTFKATSKINSSTDSTFLSLNVNELPLGMKVEIFDTLREQNANIEFEPKLKDNPKGNSTSFCIQAKSQGDTLFSISKRQFAIRIKPTPQIQDLFFDTLVCYNQYRQLRFTDSPIGRGPFKIIHTLLDSAGQLTRNANLSFKSSNTSFSNEFTDKIQGDTFGTFIVNTHLENGQKCHFIRNDTTKIDLKRWKDSFALKDSIFCDKNLVRVEIKDSNQILKNVIWSNGDTLLKTTIGLPSNVYVIAEDTCGLQHTFSAYLDKQTSFKPQLSSKYLICRNDSLNLHYAHPDSVDVKWNSSITNQKITIADTGYYSVIAANFCDTLIETFRVEYKNLPSYQLIIDSSKCNMLSYSFETAKEGEYHFNWMLDSELKTDTILKTESYKTLQFLFGNNCQVDTTALNHKPVPFPSVELGLDTLSCDTITYQIRKSTNPKTQYKWTLSDKSSIDSTLKITGSSPVLLEVSNTCAIDSIVLHHKPTKTPMISLDLDSMLLCRGDTVGINLRSNVNDRPTWSDWDSVAINKQIHEPGLYQVYIRNRCGISRDSILVKQIDTPNPSLPTDSLIVKGLSIVLDAGPADKYNWSDSSKGRINVVSDSGWHWVRVSNKCGSTLDSTLLIFETSTIGTPSTPYANQINIYPNPFKEEIYIQTRRLIEGMQVQVFSSTGSLVYQKTNPNKIYSKNWPTGIYTIFIQVENEVIIKKVVRI